MACQAITWASVATDLCPHMVLQGPNELTTLLLNISFTKSLLGVALEAEIHAHVIKGPV